MCDLYLLNFTILVVSGLSKVHWDTHIDPIKLHGKHEVFETRTEPYNLRGSAIALAAIRHSVSPTTALEENLISDLSELIEP